MERRRKSVGLGQHGRTARIWNVDTLQQRLLFEKHGDDVNSVDWKPSGSLVVSGGSDGTFKIWEANTGEVCSSHAIGDFGCACVNFSPDGSQIAAGGSADIILWSVARSQVDRILTGHSPKSIIKNTCVIGPAVMCVKYSPDGTTLASGSRDKSIRLWQLPDDESILTLNGHNDYVTSIAWGPDGRMIASASADGTVKLWDIATALQSSKRGR